MQAWLVTSGLFHPPWRARRVLHQTLQGAAGLTFRHASSLAVLPRLALEEVGALVLYYHHRTLSPRALAALAQFVSQGGGVLAVHSATASFKRSPHYFEILGGRFTGHGAVEPIRVQPARETDGLFGGLEAFTIVDELYLHELQPGVRVHFVASHQGREVPVVWTQTYGAGRICYVCPGHATATLQNVSVQAILRRGLAWVVGR
jgi:uncharacterized protein